MGPYCSEFVALGKVIHTDALVLVRDKYGWSWARVEEARVHWSNTDSLSPNYLDLEGLLVGDLLLLAKHMIGEAIEVVEGTETSNSPNSTGFAYRPESIFLAYLW